MERPVLERGETLEAFNVRWRAWIESWTTDDALAFLDEAAAEGPIWTRAAELLRGAIERVRQRHRAEESVISGYGTVCAECLGPDEMQVPWPCATRVDLDGRGEVASWPQWRGHAAGA